MHRASTTSCLASILATVLLAGTVGCNGENVVIANGGSGGAAGAGGQGGSAAGAAGAGGTPDGCLDIRIDTSVLPQGREWTPIIDEVTRQPFWRDDSGIHMVWLQAGKPPGDDSWRSYLVTASFDPETGEHVRTHVYEAFPLDVPSGGTGIDSVAGAPDGSFAAVIGYSDDQDPYGAVARVVLGKVNVPELTAVWAPPWSAAEAATFHVGYDGQGFAVDAVSQGGSQVRLVRLRTDGTVLSPETEVGTIRGALDAVQSAFHTDPDTGTTWMVTTYEDGVWLSGHYRDGTLLAGTESRGGVEIKGQGLPGSLSGSGWPAVASDGDQALLAWLYPYGGPHLEDQTCLQRVLGSAPAADALVITDETERYFPTVRVLARLGESWWLQQLDADVGIESYELSESAVRSRSVLVDYEGCRNCGGPEYLDARSLGVASWQDELWFGYWNLSQPYPPSPSPYHIVRVAPGCSYAVELD